MSQQRNALLEEHEGRLQLALQAYNAKQFRSHQAAAAAFNVKHYTLTERAKGKPFWREIRPNCQKLTITKEQAIVQYMLNLNSRGFAPRLYKVEDMADKLLGIRGGKPVGNY